MCELVELAAWRELAEAPSVLWQCSASESWLVICPYCKHNETSGFEYLLGKLHVGITIDGKGDWLLGVQPTTLLTLDAQRWNPMLTR